MVIPKFLVVDPKHNEKVEVDVVLYDDGSVSDFVRVRDVLADELLILTPTAAEELASALQETARVAANRGQ